MKAFITGGAGFIGREVVMQLFGLKARVPIYDDFSLGRKHNIKAFENDPNLRVIKGKVENHVDLETQQIINVSDIFAKNKI